MAHLPSRQRRLGFTLVETLAALAVLAIGASALAMYLGSFRRISSTEISRTDSVLDAVRYVESQVSDPPPCIDGAVRSLSDKITVVITPVAESVPLLWLEAGAENISFRRLIRCREVSR